MKGWSLENWNCSQFKLEPHPPEHCSPDSLNCMILAHHSPHHCPHLQASYQLCFQACCQNPVHPSSMVAVLSKWKWTIAWQPSKDLKKKNLSTCQPVPKTQVESCVQCWNAHKNQRPNSGALQGLKLFVQSSILLHPDFAVLQAGAAREDSSLHNLGLRHGPTYVSYVWASLQQPPSGDAWAWKTNEGSRQVHHWCQSCQIIFENSKHVQVVSDVFQWQLYEFLCFSWPGIS